MKIYFFFNHIDLVVDRFKKRIFQRLTKETSSIIIEPIGDLPGMDAIGGPNAITEEHCLRKIDFLSHRWRRRDTIVFTGTIAGLYMESITKQYPDFEYYFLKNTIRPMTQSEIDFYLGFGEFDENWLKQTNSTILANMESFSNKQLINWQDIRDTSYNTHFNFPNAKEGIKIGRYTL